MPKAYQDKKERIGSDSAVTVKLTRIPEGFQLHAKHFAATIYTSTPGDYTTAKFIYLGYEQAGVKFYLEGFDVQSGTDKNTGVVVVKDVIIPELADPFAYFEATATTEKYEVMINGVLEKIEK